MTIHKLRTAIVTLVFLAAVAAGGGYLARSIAMGDEPRKAAGRLSRPPPAPGPMTPTQKPAPGRMFVVGRVLDPQGKPVPNATVAISLRRKLLFASPRFRGVLSGAGRPRGERRLGPVPARCGPRLVGPSRAVRRHRAGARLRRRLGRPRPRRGPAVGRDQAHARAGHRGPPLRRARPARPGRGGLGLGDLAHPPADRARAGSGHRDRLRKDRSAGGAASTTGRAGRSRRRPTPTAASPCTASAAACTPG